MNKFIEAPEEIKKILRTIKPEDVSPPKEDYVLIRVKGYRKAEHRHIWEKHNGAIPEGKIIHHKNGNKRDNRIENLQMVTFQQHMNIHKKWKNQ